MGRYKWGYESPDMDISIQVTLLITPFITTHESPSIEEFCNFGCCGFWGLGFGWWVCWVGVFKLSK